MRLKFSQQLKQTHLWKRFGKVFKSMIFSHHEDTSKTRNSSRIYLWQSRSPRIRVTLIQPHSPTSTTTSNVSKHSEYVKRAHSLSALQSIQSIPMIQTVTLICLLNSMINARLTRVELSTRKQLGTLVLVKHSTRLGHISVRIAPLKHPQVASMFVSIWQEF